jgi:hypothetical protein
MGLFQIVKKASVPELLVRHVSEAEPSRLVVRGTVPLIPVIVVAFSSLLTRLKLDTVLTFDLSRRLFPNLKLW